VRIADRVVAVVEPEGEIAWRGQGRQLRIEQRRGNVFYRVEGGRPLTVASPAGEVMATGTCFRITLRGPQGSTAAYVQLLEGAVEVRNGEGKARLAAGEWARMTADLPPQRLAAGALPSGLEPAPGQTEERPSETPAGDPVLPPRGKFFAFTHQERQALARRCNFRWGLPRSITRPEQPLDLDRAGELTTPERVAVERLLEQHRAQYFERLRVIHREVTGAAHVDPGLSAMALFREIDVAASKAEGRTARRRILLEWADDLEPPADEASLSGIERFWRLEVGVLDDLTRRLAEVIGPERAHTLVQHTLGYSASGNETGCPSGRRAAL
jgi:hypothetical protein